MWCAPRFNFRPSPLYINDLPNASRIVEPLLFADDTSICYSHSDPVVLAAVLNEALQSIGSWMRANKLSVNIDKTAYVIFHSRHKKVSYDISLSFEDKCITRKPKVKVIYSPICACAQRSPLFMIQTV